MNTLLSAQQFCKSKTALGFPGSSVVMNLPAKQETWVLSLGQEDHLERKWKPTPIFLPGKSHGQRNLAGYNLWGPKRVGHDLAAKQLQNSSKKIKSIIQNKTKLSVSWQLRFKPRLFWF